MWRKRGISLVPCKYSINYFPLPMYCHISVYEGDGTISVATGGIEMGQGLNTKVGNRFLSSIVASVLRGIYVHVTTKSCRATKLESILSVVV
jgi:xanthine dehydrogenase molybdopterin-binding subunit B